MSQYQRAILFLLTVIFVVSVGRDAVCQRFQGREHSAQLIECYDGDTCTFRVALGFGVEVTLRVRLCDVYAAEIRGTYGKEQARAQAARAEAVGLLQSGPIILRFALKSRCSDPNRCVQMTLDRYMAEWIAGDVNVGGTLVKRGLARWAKGKEPTCARKR